MGSTWAAPEAVPADFLLRMKNTANKAARITTASPTPIPIPAAAPVDKPPPEEVSEDDELVEVEEAVAPAVVAVSTVPSVPVADVVAGATAFSVRLVLGYVWVTVSQGMLNRPILQKISHLWSSICHLLWYSSC
jgi:hypothetical protein